MSIAETQSLVFDGRGGVVIALRSTGGGPELELAATGRRWIIGSAASCDLVIADPFVSQVHCVLERREGGGLVVRDHGSRNGTRVDGNPVEGAELRVGSYLAIGRTTLVAVAGLARGPRRALESLRGHDPALRVTIEHAMRAAPSDCNVLIVGETGTGKDLLARAIHEASRRLDEAFVAVNCGAIPRELIGSELFGHDKGAFTGAHAEREGYFVEADGGTLFLDEIGELPLELQPNLLRVLETRRVRRVGGAAERAVDVRIIAATNRLDGLGTESSRLRLDLYHRVATVVLALPPLRERMGDLPDLVESILDELEAEHGVRKISDDAWLALGHYDWPGNVRELRHAIARAVALGDNELGPRDFFPDLGNGVGLGRHTLGTAPPPLAGEELPPYESMLRGAMEQALRSHGSIRAAADQLGMPKSTFADKARQWGLAPRRKPIRGLPPRKK
jgi:DNA-binding NtrC family response regulator